MLVLLPPSEGKAASGRGAPLKPESLSLPGLAEARAAVLDELVELCVADEEKAREVLGLSEGLRGEIAKNAGLRTAGARPAGEIYTGVLYDALGRLAGHSPALVIRTLPNDLAKLSRRYEGAAPAPYLTREAADVVVAAGVRHLVVDVPSLDRAQDAGRLVAHRAYWGLPPGGKRLNEASRRDCTITELAWIAPTIRDGWYLMSLQIPALMTDAVPSRPLLYPARPHE